MNLRRAFITSVSLSSLLFLSGCLGLSTVDYNNEVVDHINPTLNAMERSLDVYEVSVPLTVYDDSVIDNEAMEDSYDEARAMIDGIDDLMVLEGSNSDQVADVQESLKDYKEISEEYLELYSDMLNYYTDMFREDLSKVEMFDNNLYDLYNEYVDVHNELVDTLELYI